jgi:hypothetical protein
MAPIVAYVNQLGYLHCVACVESRNIPRGNPVHADCGWADKCDGCGCTVGEPYWAPHLKTRIN